MFVLSRFMSTGIAMIDLHYGHLAVDSHEHAVSLLDALAPERAVCASLFFDSSSLSLFRIARLQSSLRWFCFLHGVKRRRPVLRDAVLATGLTTLALLAAGCGAAKSPSVAHLGTTTTTTVPQSSARPSGVLYASCMRAHGVAGFPDSAISVNAAGQVELRVPVDIKNEAGFLSASRACQRDLPNSSSAPSKSVNIHEALEYAECMRSHGIPDFPDPLPGGGFNIPGNTNTPQFQAAQTACGAKPGSRGVHPNGP